MNDYKEKYNFYLEKINTRLNMLLGSSSYGDETVCDAMKYSVKNGGKRVRPVLVLECCRICGGDIEAALDTACALEMVHTYSLIHDDLPCMDDDDYRRGKPSCHIKFGEEYALLAGDALLTYAFEVISKSKLSDEKKVKAVACLSENAGYNGMVGGQVIDLRSEGQSISYERLRTMHSLKTGALIKCAVKLGCICAGADSEKTEKLIKYAENLGLSFQIRDDILDVTGTQDELGKPIGSDKEEGKTTYVTLFGLEEAERLSSESTKRAVDALRDFSFGEFLISLAEGLSVRKS